MNTYNKDHKFANHWATESVKLTYQYRQKQRSLWTNIVGLIPVFPSKYIFPRWASHRTYSHAMHWCNWKSEGLAVLAAIDSRQLREKTCLERELADEIPILKDSPLTCGCGAAKWLLYYFRLSARLQPADFSLSYTITYNKSHTYTITINVPLLKKLRDIIFFLRDNNFLSHFSGHFEGASTFLTP